jgi:AcrR family transcriptional regulator
MLTRMSTPTREPARRGRPRSEQARKAVLEAAAELLLTDGLAAVSMDAVAARAGVSKATIYRWWRSKELLALDALYDEWDTQGNAGRDTGSLRGDVLSVLRPWVRRARERPFGHVVGGLVVEVHSNDDFAEQYRERFVEPRRAPIRAAFARAIERGEIPEDTDVEAAVDLLYGALYHRMLHRHAPLNDRFVTEIVDLTLAGISARG